MTRSVLLIYTGGTIGMMEDPETGSLIPFDFEKLSAQVPELHRFDLSLKAISFDPLIDSSDLRIEHWQELAGLIEENYHAFDGFVILHGTDTMAYSASALSYMLEGLRKPVIFTGSQLPIGVLRTDGKENLISAIELASKYVHDEAVIKEVAIYFGSSLYRGNRTHKYSTEAFNAIRSPNMPALAEAGIHVHIRKDLLYTSDEHLAFCVHRELEPRVVVLKLFPGICEDVVRSICSIPGLRGIVIETFGSGNAPRADWFVDSLREAADRGVFLVNVTQCNEGFVEQGRYATSEQLQKLGVIPAADMTLEAALTKMIFLLPRCNDRQEFEKQMLTPLRGELTISSSLV